MREQGGSEELNEEAARWVARRLNADAWTEEDEAGLRDWLAGSTARRDAYDI